MINGFIKWPNLATVLVFNNPVYCLDDSVAHSRGKDFHGKAIKKKTFYTKHLTMVPHCY